MMKRFIFLILCIPILASCAVSNRIINIDNPNKDLKSFKLVQTPHAYSSGEDGLLSARLKVNVTSTYLFEEKGNAHPQITVYYKILPALKTSMTELFYNLDGEIIKVASEEKITQGNFIIPENLWVSLIHAQKIHCSLKGEKEGIDMELNPKEKNKLSQFFQLAIKQRDVQFPAIPEGKKKW